MVIPVFSCMGELFLCEVFCVFEWIYIFLLTDSMISVYYWKFCFVVFSAVLSCCV